MTQLEDPQKTVEQQLTNYLPLFIALVWKSLDLPPPTRAQIAISQYLQNGPKRLQIQAFRGLGKSWIAAAFVLWTLWIDRDKKILVISASKQRADDFTIFCQKCILEFDWLAHLRPMDDDQRWSRVSFDVAGCRPAQAPSVKSVGITGQITGSRADLIVFDDVEVPANSATDFMREKLLQLVTEGESVLTPKKDSRIVFLGTPQTTFTIYRTLRERNYRPFVWPARYPKDLTGYDEVLAPQLVQDIQRGAR
ncbi:MAG: phage terminase large subunit [Burkholderiaceae bacterium]